MVWDTTPSRRCAITIAAAQVESGGVSSFTVLISQASLPSEIFSIAKTNGADVRLATGNDGTGLLTCDVISWDAGNSKCLLAVGPVTLSAVVDNTLWVSYGDAAASAQTGTDAYGSVWSAFWPFQEGVGTSVIDRISAISGTIQNIANPWTTGNGVLANGIAFAGDSDSRQRIDCGDVLDWGGQHTLLAYISSTSPSGVICLKADTANVNIGYTLNLGATSGRPNWCIDYQNQQTTSLRDKFYTSELLSSGIWTHIAAGYGTGTNNPVVYIDGSAATMISFRNGSVPPAYDTAYQFQIGGRDTDVDAQFFQGTIGYIGVLNTQVGIEWIATHERNVSAPATFAVPGTPENVSGSSLILASFYYQRLMQ